MDRYNLEAFQHQRSWLEQVRDLPTVLGSWWRDQRTMRLIYSAGFVCYSMKLGLLAICALVYLVVR